MKNVRMTRCVAMLAACLMLLGAGIAGAAAETAVVDNPDPTDRLNLRESAKSGAKILRKYYSGVAVEVLSSAGDWAKVRIGTAEGYMQKQFLATGTAAASVRSAVPMGQVDVTYPQTKLALRERESDSANAVGSYDQGTAVAVLGVADGWLHVRVVADGRTGFMRSAWVTQTENLRHAAVHADKATLRQEPKAGAKALGAYGRNVPMVVLFSFEKLEGWSRVRIGDTVGFMQNGDLAFNPEPGTADFAPEGKTVRNNGSYVNLRKAASTDASSLEKLDDGTAVSVLGTAGDWTHVEADGVYGYIQSKYLK